MAFKSVQHSVEALRITAAQGKWSAFDLVWDECRAAGLATVVPDVLAKVERLDGPPDLRETMLARLYRTAIAQPAGAKGARVLASAVLWLRPTAVYRLDDQAGREAAEFTRAWAATLRADSREPPERRLFASVPRLLRPSGVTLGAPSDAFRAFVRGEAPFTTNPQTLWPADRALAFGDVPVPVWVALWLDPAGTEARDPLAPDLAARAGAAFVERMAACADLPRFDVIRADDLYEGYGHTRAYSVWARLHADRAASAAYDALHLSAWRCGDRLRVLVGTPGSVFECCEETTYHDDVAAGLERLARFARMPHRITTRNLGPDAAYLPDDTEGDLATALYGEGRALVARPLAGTGHDDAPEAPETAPHPQRAVTHTALPRVREWLNATGAARLAEALARQHGLVAAVPAITTDDDALRAVVAAPAARRALRPCAVAALAFLWRGGVLLRVRGTLQEMLAETELGIDVTAVMVATPKADAYVDFADPLPWPGTPAPVQGVYVHWARRAADVWAMALLPVAQDEAVELPPMRLTPARPDEPVAATLRRARVAAGGPAGGDAEVAHDGLHVLLAALLYLTLDDARLSESLVRVADGALDAGGDGGLARPTATGGPRWANFAVRSLALGPVEVHLDEPAGSGVERTWRKGRLHVTPPGRRAPRLVWDAPQRVTQAFAPVPPSSVSS
ncbi:MAG: hypothetical protein U1F10_13590 [Burkholderiales bacterium]